MKLTASLMACLLIAAPAAASPSRITVKVERAALSDFMREVSRQARVEFVLAKDLAQEKISACMTAVTVGDVLDVLKNYKGIDAVKTKAGYELARRPS